MYSVVPPGDVDSPVSGGQPHLKFPEYNTLEFSNLWHNISSFCVLTTCISILLYNAILQLQCRYLQHRTLVISFFMCFPQEQIQIRLQHQKLSLPPLQQSRPPILLNYFYDIFSSCYEDHIIIEHLRLLKAGSTRAGCSVY